MFREDLQKLIHSVECIKSKLKNLTTMAYSGPSRYGNLKYVGLEQTQHMSGQHA